MLSLNDPSLLRTDCLLDGSWQAADNGGRSEVFNPSTGQLIAAVPAMGVAETGRAIDSSRKAFDGWKQRTAESRAIVLRRWFELMMANLDDLACLMTSEQGKPLAESRGEVAYAASYIEWFAEEARRVCGSTVPSPWADRKIV